MKDQQRKKVAIIGAGPSGMIAAWFLAPYYEVTLFDKNSRPGRKLLVAGRGGLNLTHDTDTEDLIKSYHPQGFLDRIIRAFDNKSFRNWLSDIGIETYTGSSGKVFPIKGITPANFLNTIFTSLLKRGVEFLPNHKLISITPDKVLTFSIVKTKHYKSDIGSADAGISDVNNFNTTFERINDNNPEGAYIQKSQEEQVTFTTDFVILALGGASWKITGSDGLWTKIIEELGIRTLPFQHSNCGVNISWNENIKMYHTGRPLKNILCGIYGSEIYKVSGEALITETGLQGTAIYPLIPEIRQLLAEGKECNLLIDFKPQNDVESLLRKVNSQSKSSKYKEIFHIDGAQLSVIKAFVSKEEYLDPFVFCRNLKRVIIRVHSLRPLDECISVIGGIPFEALDFDLSLKKYPFIYTIGEMVDWDAPTGGYLLQACFSMGTFVAKQVENRNS